MKLERLLSIIILLLNRRMVQAKDLAEQFEVSTRTIYRDIEAINGAGIPIVTYQGTNGGIGLAEGYRLDRNVLNNDELAAIVTALRSISTSYGNEQHARLMEKMSSVVPPAYAEEFQHKTNRVLIDYSPWDGIERLRSKLQLLNDAIDRCLVVKFIYSNAEGEVTDRIVEPHILIFKGKSWYVKAYCVAKEQFRLFKLHRMKALEVDAERTFTRRELPSQEQAADKSSHDTSQQMTEFVLRFHDDSRHVAEEWFGIEEMMPMEDGTWQVKKAYREDEWLYSFILSLSHHAEVVEPPHLREIIAHRAEQIAKKYRNNETT
ncbi:YafY family transcriptional regulator [Bacillaceae bacterium SIJ1]|uniref:helix-turn-helix transcriptional regulator n=1 Tax=Litoribacterium kuwaitense TaxID=1398745 RepID=UPI0013EA8662|nr:YafY family protein [Litoribacterium kuwaitense]NGP45649.1 YafY family transcriptional regulator [Litoribacterium kuwaitense]